MYKRQGHHPAVGPLAVQNDLHIALGGLLPVGEQLLGDDGLGVLPHHDFRLPLGGVHAADLGALQIDGGPLLQIHDGLGAVSYTHLEKQRGISVTSSVMQFQYEGYCINILDTPGHQDFSEDTYRTLMAADSAVMVIDAAKGCLLYTSRCV